jgi:putative transposase
MSSRRGWLPVQWPIHVTNRGNDRRQIFFHPADYEGFLALLAKAGEKFDVDLLGYAVMPNHFHLVVAQRSDRAVSAYLHWVSCCAACNFRSETGTVGAGHVFQRRYWSQVLSDVNHYLTALRYVEANALRARLVERAEEWKWGSLWERHTAGRRLLADSPVALPPEWRGIVNGVQAADEVDACRRKSRFLRNRQGAFSAGVDAATRQGQGL